MPLPGETGPGHSLSRRRVAHGRPLAPMAEPTRADPGPFIHFKTGLLPRPAVAVPTLQPSWVSHHPDDQAGASVLTDRMGNHPNGGKGTLPVVPASFYPFKGNPDNQYLGNDVVGDCVAACAGHWVNHLSYLSGGPILVDRKLTLDLYQTISRWNGIVGDRSDNGSHILDMLSFLLETGLAGYQINAFAQLNLLYNYTDAPWGYVELVRDLDPGHGFLKSICYDFGAVIMGLFLPFSALTQFHANQPWTLDKTSKIDGGHCIVMVGYDDDYAYCYTYGRCVPVAWDWITFYVYEAYAVATDKQLETSVWNKYNRKQLNDEWYQITGHENDPF